MSFQTCVSTKYRVYSNKKCLYNMIYKFIYQTNKVPSIILQGFPPPHLYCHSFTCTFISFIFLSKASTTATTTIQRFLICFFSLLFKFPLQTSTHGLGLTVISVQMERLFVQWDVTFWIILLAPSISLEQGSMSAA